MPRGGVKKMVQARGFIVLGKSNQAVLTSGDQFFAKLRILGDLGHRLGEGLRGTGIKPMAGVASHFGQYRSFGREDGKAGLEGLNQRNAKPFMEGGKDQGAGKLPDSLKRIIRQVAGKMNIRSKIQSRAHFLQRFHPFIRVASQEKIPCFIAGRVAVLVIGGKQHFVVFVWPEISGIKEERSGGEGRWSASWFRLSG